MRHCLINCLDKFANLSSRVDEISKGIRRPEHIERLSPEKLFHPPDK
jgi:hypothetical protein